MKRLTFISLFVALCFVAFTGTYAEDLFFDSDGVKIRYIVQGEGEPVMLIHGFSASLDTNWGGPGIIADLAKDYRVIALDNRGHGKSGKPHGKENYGANMVRDVIRLLDHLDIEKAHIVGYSMGGFMTTNLVANYPDRIISAVPAGAGWARPGDPAVSTMSKLADSLEAGKGFGPLLAGLTPEGQEKPNEEMMKSINAMLTAQNDVLALAGAVRGMADLSVTEEQLKANKVPTLSIIGEIDPLRAGVDTMAEVMSNLEVVVVEGADHMTCFTNPAFMKSLRQFLAKHSDGHKYKPSDKGRDKGRNKGRDRRNDRRSNRHKLKHKDK